MILIVDASEADGVPIIDATRATLSEAINSDLDDAALSATFVFYTESDSFKVLKAPDTSRLRLNQILPMGLFSTRVRWAYEWHREHQQT